MHTGDAFVRKSKSVKGLTADRRSEAGVSVVVVVLLLLLPLLHTIIRSGQLVESG